jgi:hypothetical protein
MSKTIKLHEFTGDYGIGHAQLGAICRVNDGLVEMVERSFLQGDGRDDAVSPLVAHWGAYSSLPDTHARN